MADYRLYFLNEQGHIERVEEFEANDDVSAIAFAKLESDTAKELWCSRRRVERFPALSH